MEADEEQEERMPKQGEAEFPYTGGKLQHLL